MTARTRWLDEGLNVLAELGAPALRIDRLAERLGLTKGSFYHHFDGMAGYKRDLLAHFEQRDTSSYIDAVESDNELDARGRLERLMELALATPEDGLEVAIRAWALQDDDVRAAQERVDMTRVNYIREQFIDAGADDQLALDSARTIYLLLIGSENVVPPLPRDDLRRLWERALADMVGRPPTGW